MDDSVEDVAEEMYELEVGKRSERETTPEYKSQFAHLYKENLLLSTQTERRRQHLELLKSRRSNTVDKMRNLTDVLSNEFEDIFASEVDFAPEQAEAMEVEESNKRQKKRYNCRKKLMLSEWLLERPDDFESNWMVKLCPTGKRHLVVAENRITKAYNKDGRLLNKFTSVLPGGNADTINRRAFTVLDCIFNPHKQNYYVIDVIAWNSLSLRQMDVEFRYFWLKSKLSESEEFQTRIPGRNFHPFYEIETFPSELLEEKLSHPLCIGNEQLFLDGILFYLKEVPYLMRITPLVGWLKVFMVREVLGINISDCFPVPPNYTTITEYLAMVEKLGKEKRKNRKKKAAPRAVDVPRDVPIMG